MAKLYGIFLIALALVHATARDIPSDNTKPTNVVAATSGKTETVVTTADAPVAARGVDDKKNFIAYGGGIGGWAGMGYVGGFPMLGGGIGGASGIGGVGGIGGLGGLGGVGGVGGAGGLGGLHGVGVGGGAGSAGGAGGLGGLRGVGVGGAAGGAAGKAIP